MKHNKKSFSKQIAVLIIMLMVFSVFAGASDLLASAGGKVFSGGLNFEYLEYLEDAAKGNTEKYGAYIPSPATANVVPSNVGAALPATYDPRSENLVTAVKNQGENGVCWAFTAIGAVETYIIKQTGRQLSFSEEHMRFYLSGQNPETDAFLRSPDAGGNFEIAASYLLNRLGAVSQSSVPYRGSRGQSWQSGVMSGAEIRSYVNGTAAVANNTAAIKAAIQESGSVASTMWAGDGLTAASLNKFFNSASNAFYYNETAPNNHAVLIVGWDDNFSRNNFNSSISPAGNGAWLVKNSWGSNFGDEGYFWVSYEDRGICSNATKWRITGNESVNSDKKILSLDETIPANSYGFGNSGGGRIFAANVFDISSSDAADYNLTEAVFYSWEADVDFKIYINKIAENTMTPVDSLGAPAAEGRTEVQGYMTVGLSSPFSFSGAGKYAVTVELYSTHKTPYAAFEFGEGNASSSKVYNPSIEQGESYISGGGAWLDLKDQHTDSNANCGNWSIKANLTRKNTSTVAATALNSGECDDRVSALTAEFNFNGNFFEYIKFEGAFLPEGTAYTVQDSLITLSRAFLDTLNNGEISVLEFYFSDGGFVEFIIYPPAVALKSVNISGSARTGNTLTADIKFTIEPESEPDIIIVWQISADGTAWSDVSGANGLTFDLSAEHHGLFVRVVVTAEKGPESNVLDGSVTSAATAAVRYPVTAVFFEGTLPEQLQLGQSCQFVVISNAGEGFFEGEIIWTATNGCTIDSDGRFVMDGDLADGVVITVKAVFADNEEIYVSHSITIKAVSFESSWVQVETDSDAVADNGWLTAAPKITFNLPQEFDIVLINGEEYPPDYIFEPSTGEYEIRFKNSATKEITASKNFTFQIDTVSPFIIFGNYQNDGIAFSVTVPLSVVVGESGIRSVTVNGSEITDLTQYVIKEDGTYVFVLIDNAGREFTHTITVNNIMTPQKALDWAVDNWIYFAAAGAVILLLVILRIHRERKLRRKIKSKKRRR